MKKPQQYRKKPVVIEAMQFPNDGPGQHEVSMWVETNGGKINLYDGAVEENVKTDTDANWRWKYGSIETLEGAHRVNQWDWVIKGVKGEFYPCKPDIFEQTYEAVSPSNPSGKE